MKSSVYRFCFVWSFTLLNCYTKPQTFLHYCQEERKTDTEPDQNIKKPFLSYNELSFEILDDKSLFSASKHIKIEPESVDNIFFFSTATAGTAVSKYCCVNCVPLGGGSICQFNEIDSWRVSWKYFGRRRKSLQGQQWAVGDTKCMWLNMK